MSRHDDLALTLVLEGRQPDTGNPELAAAVEAAEADVERIRRGLHLAAATLPDLAPKPARRRVRVPAVAAALILAVGSAAVAVSVIDDGSGTGPQRTRPTDPAVASEVPPPSLVARVAEADRIVVGTVTDVTYGELATQGGLPYVLATVDVSETIKPAGAGGSVVAFDYALDGTSSASSGPAWEQGQKLLLFLVSDVGTVSEGVQPAHLQIAGGAGGRFAFDGDRLLAPFTLDQIRQAVHTQGANP